MPLKYLAPMKSFIVPGGSRLESQFEGLVRCDQFAPVPDLGAELSAKVVIMMRQRVALHDKRVERYKSSKVTDQEVGKTASSAKNDDEVGVKDSVVQEDSWKHEVKEQEQSDSEKQLEEEGEAWWSLIHQCPMFSGLETGVFECE